MKRWIPLILLYCLPVFCFGKGNVVVHGAWNISFLEKNARDFLSIKVSHSSKYDSFMRLSYIYDVNLAIIHISEQDTIFREKVISARNTKTNANEFDIKFSIDSFAGKYAEFYRHIGHFPVGEYDILVTFSTERNNDKIVKIDRIYFQDTLISESSKLFSFLKKSESTNLKQFSGELWKKKLEKAIEKKGRTFTKKDMGSDLRYQLYYLGLYEGYFEINKLENSRKFSVKIPPHNSPVEYLNSESVKQRLLKFQKSSAVNNNLTGDIFVQYNFGNAQEVNSALQNNYYDVQGSLSLPILGIPVLVNGYYTQLDKHRTLKSSFINVNFDKERYLKMLEEYQAEMNMIQLSNVTGDFSFEKYYGNIVDSLKKQVIATQSRLELLLKESINESRIDTVGSEYKNKMNTKNKYLENLNQQKDQMEASIASGLAKINRIEKLLHQISERKLIDELEDAKKKYGSKITDVSNLGSLKTIESLFPNNHLVGQLKRINSFNVGAFSNTISKYTNPGQLTKGASINYDLGIVDALFSIGRMDVLGFNGTKEKYNTGSLGLTSKSLKNQIIHVNYFTSIPVRNHVKGLGDGVITGNLSKIYTLAYSLRSSLIDVMLDYSYSDNAKGIEDNVSIKNNILEQSNFEISTEIKAIKNKLLLINHIERLGSKFNNDALYYNIKGLLNYGVGIKSSVFRDMLQFELTYNVLSDNNSSKSNVKYGFDVQTHFKRYPKVRFFYKPYTTFSTVVDTILNSSFMLAGSIYGVKADYRIKHKHLEIISNLNYNSSTSRFDTISYSNKLWSFNIFTNYKSIQVMATLGYMYVVSNFITPTQSIMNNNSFFTLNINKNLRPNLTTGMGFQIAIADNGTIIRSGFSTTINYFLAKPNVGLSFRGQYSKFNIGLLSNMIFQGSLGLQIPINTSIK